MTGGIVKRINRGVLVFWLSAVAALSLLIAGVSAQQPQDGRPRTTGTATQNPTPTPTPVQTGPGRRIAPQLGEPPPVPTLKPKPTPTPEPTSAEIDENSTLVMNAELVTLNVRVIDRNNRPINGIRESDFKVFEDGVPQKIFCCTPSSNT